MRDTSKTVHAILLLISYGIEDGRSIMRHEEYFIKEEHKYIKLPITRNI